MDLQSVTLWKNRVAKTAAGLSILFVLFTLDSSVAYLREPSNAFRLLPGQSSRLTGPLSPDAVAATDMTYESTSNQVSISMEEVNSEFWFGGRIWRGTLRVAPDGEPGKYKVIVFGKADRRKVGANTFQVMVYKDRAAKLADSKSLFMRATGLNPMIFAVGFFGLVLLCCAGLYFIAGIRDRLMAEQGEAEVYHVTRDKEGAIVYFGLGAMHGIQGGAKLVLMDNKRQPVEEITVDSVNSEDSRARVGPLVTVEAGYLVKRI